MWNAFMQFIFNCIQFFFGIIGDWGLAIIAVTVILRLILLPMTIKSQRSMADMQVLAPKLQEIQERYKDDPQRLQQAMMEFQAENKFNPLGGCLPLFLQMPIFIALFQVLRSGHLPADAGFLSIIPDLATVPSSIFASQGFVAAIPYIILVLLFGVLTMIPMMLMQQTGPNAQMSKIMGVVMAVMMMWFGWSSPTGVLLFWDTSAAWGLVQQQIVMRTRKKQIADKEAEEIVIQPVEVDVVRKQRKPRPTKKGRQ